EAAARGLGVQLLPLEVRGPDEFAGAFQAATQGHAQALIMVQSPLFKLLPGTARGAGAGEPPANDVWRGGGCQSRGTHELWTAHTRELAPRCHICGQDPQRR